jgi:hypothetical protein
MARRTSVGALAPAVLLIVLWGCGSSASPTAQSSTAASQAAPSVAAPSVAEPSAAESVGAPSLAIPSFSLPSEAKDLEALLPDTICGATAQKASLSGASFMATATEEFKSALAALGKQASDVALAVEFSTGGDACGAGIFRVKGADQGALQQAILDAFQKSGSTFTQGSVGGKNVYISVEGTGKQYTYFAGDAVIFAQAKDDATAAPILQALPGG